MAISKEDILEAVGALSVMELNDLVKAFEEKFGNDDGLRFCYLGGDFGDDGLFVIQIETQDQPPKMMFGDCMAGGPPASHRFEHGVRS